MGLNFDKRPGGNNVPVTQEFLSPVDYHDEIVVKMEKHKMMPCQKRWKWQMNECKYRRIITDRF